MGQCTQTPFLNPDPFQHWYGVKNIVKVKINGESCMALLNNGMQINTITPSYVKSCSPKVGPIADLIGGRVTCIGPNSPGSTGFIKFCRKDSCYLWDSHYKPHHKCHEREGDGCLGQMQGWPISHQYEELQPQ